MPSFRKTAWSALAAIIVVLFTFIAMKAIAGLSSPSEPRDNVAVPGSIQEADTDDYVQGLARLHIVAMPHHRQNNPRGVVEPGGP